MPPRKDTSQTRKRARAQADEEPTPAAAPTTKKRRLKAPGDAPDDAASKPRSVVSKAVNGGTASAGRRTAAAPKRPLIATRHLPAPLKDDPWEIPDSDDEDTKPRQQQPLAKKPPTKRSRLPVAASTVAAAKVKIAPRDAPDSGDELSSAVATPQVPRQKNSSAAGAARESKSSHAAAKPPQPGRAPRGRPKKQPVTLTEAQEEGLTGTTATKPQAAGRAAGLEPIEESAEHESDSEKTVAPKTKQQRRGAGAKPARSLKATGALAKAESRKNDGHVEETFEEALLKATGSSSKPARWPKQQNKKDPDVDGQPKAEHGGQSRSEGDQSAETDDEVCAVCSRPDSDRGNEIVLCDNCDLGFHQKCCGLAAIPEGDWICPSCSQDEAPSLLATGQDRGATVAVAARGNHVPDIDNFEHHLRAMQRVLLDRCAGRRQIKLRGQDEAYEKAAQLVEQSIVAGEGNSMLVIGARGCGKTTVSSRCLFLFYLLFPSQKQTPLTIDAASRVHRIRDVQAL